MANRLCQPTSYQPQTLFSINARNYIELYEYESTTADAAAATVMLYFFYYMWCFFDASMQEQHCQCLCTHIESHAHFTDRIVGCCFDERHKISNTTNITTNLRMMERHKLLANFWRLNHTSFCVILSSSVACNSKPATK